MGTHIIAGGKEYVVEDTGDFDRYGVDFDMYFGDHGTAQNFGHQDMEVFFWLIQWQQHGGSKHTPHYTCTTLPMKIILNLANDTQSGEVAA